MKKKVSKVIVMVLVLTVFINTTIYGATLDDVISTTNGSIDDVISSNEESQIINDNANIDENVQYSTNKIILLGDNLSNEEKELMLQYFNPADDVKVIYITNEDERKYLTGLIPDNKIGTHTYSCCYIELTDNGGINVKTVNLDYVTSDMIRNAVITSGITNANIIAASPRIVSGTGSLTGIFKGYESLKGESLDNEKQNIATQELIITADLDGELSDSDKDASTIIGELKDEVIQGELSDEQSITDIVKNYFQLNGINISGDATNKIISLLKGIGSQDYSSSTTTANSTKTSDNNDENIFTEIGNFFTNLWNKIIGKSDNVNENDTVNNNIDGNDNINETNSNDTGILDSVSDTLLGDNAKITQTDIDDIGEDITNRVEDIKNQASDNIDNIKNVGNETSTWWDSIKEFFRGIFS